MRCGKPAAVDYDEKNRLSHVLLAVENIDAEKRKANRLLYLSVTDLMTEIRNRGSGEKKIRDTDIVMRLRRCITMRICAHMKAKRLWAMPIRFMNDRVVWLLE